jgi:hypothetical protein
MTAFTDYEEKRRKGILNNAKLLMALNLVPKQTPLSSSSNLKLPSAKDRHPNASLNNKRKRDASTDDSNDNPPLAKRTSAKGKSTDIDTDLCY